MGDEKRRAARIKTALVVQYSVDHPAYIKWDTTAVKDISEGGICITTMTCLKPADEVLFHIKTPSNPLHRIDVHGRVVESAQLKTLLGERVAGTFITRISFLDLKEEDGKIIKDYVEWFLKKSGGSP